MGTSTRIVSLLRLAALIAIVALGGACSGSAAMFPEYPAGSLSTSDTEFTNGRRVSACLDIAVRTVESREVYPRVLLKIDFGNRCDRTIDVDFTQLRVTGTCNERAASFAAFDPRREIAPGRLSAFDQGVERIAFGAAGCERLPESLCVDASRLTSDGAEHGASFDAKPICFSAGIDIRVERDRT